MTYKEYKRNCDKRWDLLAPKLKRYNRRFPDTWRNYSFELLFTLARNRLNETYETYRSIGRVDEDNLIDAMNFCDFLMCKISPIKNKRV